MPAITFASDECMVADFSDDADPSSVFAYTVEATPEEIQKWKKVMDDFHAMQREIEARADAYRQKMEAASVQ